MILFKLTVDGEKYNVKTQNTILNQSIKHYFKKMYQLRFLMCNQNKLHEFIINSVAFARNSIED